MGIPLWESPSSKAADKPSASARCNTLPTGTWFDPTEFTAESPSAESGQRVVIDLTGEEASNLPPPATLTTTGTTSATGTTGTTNTTGTTGTTTTSRRRDGTSTMLTLDEFLRETSLMTAATNEAERRLQLMLVQRRGERERERERERDTPSSVAEAQWRRSFFDQMPARLLQFGVAPGASSGTTTANHTPLPSAPGVSSPAVAATGSSSPRTAAGTTVTPPTATDRSGAPSSLDYFDTLANRIQRIGALQDAMMGSVRGTDPTFEEILSGAMARMPVQEPTAEPNQSDRGRNVESLRIREARLRTMQTRVDLLANEFALLRSTRREMRRVMDLENARRGLREVRTALGLVEDELGMPRRLNSVGPPDRSIARQSSLQRNPETSSGSGRDQISSVTAAFIARLRAQSGVEPPTTTADVQEQSPDTEQSASATTSTPPVESIDRRSPLMTQEQRDLLLRDEVMLIQIERIQNGL